MEENKEIKPERSPVEDQSQTLAQERENGQNDLPDFNKQKSKLKLLFIVGAVILGLIVIFLFINITLTAIGLGELNCFDCHGFNLNIKNSSTTPSTPYPTADWKTYNNDDYHFSIMYPKDWIVEEEQGLNSGRLGYIFIGPTENHVADKIYCGTHIFLLFNVNSEPQPLKNYENVNFNGIEAKYIKTVEPSGGVNTICTGSEVPDFYETYQFQSGSTFFNATIVYKHNHPLEEDKIVSQIIKSFKVTNGNLLTKLGDFPIFPGSVFGGRSPKVPCKIYTTDPDPVSYPNAKMREINCKGDIYGFEINQPISVSLSYYLNNTKNGWTCHEVDYNQEYDVHVARCTKGKLNYDLMLTGNDVKASQMEIGIPSK